ILALQGPDGEHFVVPFGGRFRVDHGLAAREALVAGRGIAPAHRWLVEDLLAVLGSAPWRSGCRRRSAPQGPEAACVYAVTRTSTDIPKKSSAAPAKLPATGIACRISRA